MNDICQFLNVRNRPIGFIDDGDLCGRRQDEMRFDLRIAKHFKQSDTEHCATCAADANDESPICAHECGAQYNGIDDFRSADMHMKSDDR